MTDSPAQLISVRLAEERERMKTILGLARTRIDNAEHLYAAKSAHVAALLTELVDLGNKFETDMQDFHRVLDQVPGMKEGDGLGPQGGALIRDAAQTLKNLSGK